MTYFSCLKLDVLQEHASRWVHTFPKVSRISLHQYHGHQEPPANYRYTVIFELEIETEAQEKQEDGSLKVSSEAFDIFAYDYFYGDLFKKVYNYENIDPYYKNEWFFFPKYSNEKLPDFAPEEPCWQLFPIERLADAEACDKAQSIVSQTVESQSEPAQECKTPVLREAVNFFTKKGEFWEVGYEGEKKSVRDLYGMRYIIHLIEKSGESVSCKDLYRAASGKTPDKIMTESTVIDQGLNIGSSKQSISDPKAKRDYAIQYKGLQNDLENAESEMERQEIAKEMDAIIPFLQERAFTNKDTKRFQSNIQKSLKTSYAAIHKAGMKKMAKHLRDHIKPDKAYGLMYTGSLTWDITL